jgi:hypothetical protein
MSTDYPFLKTGLHTFISTDVRTTEQSTWWPTPKKENKQKKVKSENSHINLDGCKINDLKQILSMSGSPETLGSPQGSPEQEDVDIQTKTPIYQSLVAALDMPHAANARWLDSIADFDNNPRLILRAPYNDGALHFVDNNGETLQIGFPAYLDVRGKYARQGPYFNMETDHGVKVCTHSYSSIPLYLLVSNQSEMSSLKKMRAQFELKPLISNSFNFDDLPASAIESSALALNIFQMIFTEVESKRNESKCRQMSHPHTNQRHLEIEPSKQPATTPFHRTYLTEDRYSLVVSTQPLLRNVPDPGKTPIRGMSLKDLKSSCTSNYLCMQTN